MVQGVFFLNRRIRVKRKFVLFVLLFIVLSVIAVIVFDAKMKPVVCSVALQQAECRVIEVVNQTAIDVLGDIGEITDSAEEVNSRSDGTLTAVSTNTFTANRIKNELILRTQNQLKNICTQRIDVPVTSIFGIDIMGSAVPSIPVYISMSAAVSGDFEEEFESAGINQTVHKLSVRLITDITVLLPSGTAQGQTETSVLIGETVIVGNTPSGLLYQHSIDNQ